MSFQLNSLFLAAPWQQFSWDQTLRAGHFVQWHLQVSIVMKEHSILNKQTNLVKKNLGAQPQLPEWECDWNCYKCQTILIASFSFLSQAAESNLFMGA